MSTFQQRFQQRVSVVGNAQPGQQSNIPAASTASVANHLQSKPRSNSIVSTQSAAITKPSTTSVRNAHNILQSPPHIQSPTSVNSSHHSDHMASLSPDSQLHASFSYHPNPGMVSPDMSYSSAVSPQPQQSYMTDYSMQTNAYQPPPQQYMPPSQPAPAANMRSFLQAVTGTVNVPTLSKPVVAPSQPKLPRSTRQPPANSYTQRHAAAAPQPATASQPTTTQPQNSIQQAQHPPSHMHQQPPAQYPQYPPQQPYYAQSAYNTQPNTDR